MPGPIKDPTTRFLSLEVKNFKSYRGQQEIGPFHSFTAIVGPNGSGKSNLMDAISFVLGVKGAQLRGSLTELLYSNTEEHREDTRPQTGYVKLRLETDGGKMTAFMRSIVPSGNSGSHTSSYAIDERTVTWTAYEEKLKSFNILVKARNFLVFQGDIEHVAGMKAVDLTRLFESISGSEAFKPEYERLEVAKHDAEERLHFVQTKKKNTAAEKKQKLEQKKEAEEHVKAQGELEKEKAKYYLWQLYHAQKDAAQADKDLAAQKELLKEVAKELMGVEKEVKAKKREVAGLAKKRLLLEQKIKTYRSEAEKKNPDNVKLKMEMERNAAKIKSQEREVKAVQEKLKAKEVKVAHLRRQKEDLEAAEQDRARNVASSKRKILDESLQTEFYQLTEEARAKTAKARVDLATMINAQDAARDSLKSKEETLATVAARISQLEEAKESASQQKVQQAKDLRHAQQDLKSKQNEHGQLILRMRHDRARRASAEEKRRKLEDQLREFKASRKEREKEQRTQETICEMKRLFKSVYGRVPEVGKVAQQGYNLALAVVMGANLDAVIVENERTANECIGYLKQKRIPPITFIPLQTVKAKPANDRLRTLGGTSKLALDLLDYEPQFEQAFLYVCGNTLVCDAEPEAKLLAFGRGPERHKVVTKDGILIAKSGAMTGGSTDNNIESRAARFDQAQNQALRQELAQVEQDLASIPAEDDSRHQLQQLESDVKHLQSQISLLERELQADQGRTAGAEQDIEVLSMKKADLLPDIHAAQQEIEARQAKIDSIRERINAVEDRIFAGLSKKAGLANIREYMEANKAEIKQQQDARIAYAKQRAKVTQQLEYEQKASMPELNRMTAALQMLKDRQAELESQESEARKTAKAVEQEVASQVEQMSSLKEAVEAVEADLKSLKHSEASKREAGSKLQREMRDLEAVLEAVATKQADILHVAQLEQVQLPRKDDKDDDESEAMETDAAENDAAQAQSIIARLDFSCLSREHKSTSAGIERDKVDEVFRADIEQRASKLATVAPNLKAVDQFQEAKVKDDKEKAELEEARRELRETADAYNSVLEQRRDAFMTAFDHIKDVIDPIYKDLTKSRVHPLGGTAYLHLESEVSQQDQPFLAGVNFTAMPPGKRWRMIEALSGGEKTVAALALLFAVHNYHPAPFFVLDEIDAALDASNVAKVANYIREKTRPDVAEFQAVVISLKDYFFSKADSLVGVTRDPQSGFSQTFTLDLNKFGEPEQ